MRPRDFALLCAVCVVWGLNFVVSKWIVVGDGVPGGFSGLPPMFAVGIRFAIASVVLAPLLRPIPRDLPAIVGAAAVYGAAHFGLVHAGVLTASASAAAIVIQLGTPFTALLSVVMLGERIGWRRAVGIALAFSGVTLIAFEPDQLTLSIGLAFIAAGAFCGAWGSILVKRLAPIGAIRLQAWIVVCSTPMLLAGSLAAESGQLEGLASGGWRLAGAQAFVVVGVTLFAHTAYVWLLRRYEASFISPLTLMSPVWGVVFGVTLMGDAMSAKFFVGAALALAGVAVVAMRTGRRGQEPAAVAEPDS